MPLPLKTRLFWSAYKLVERAPAMQQPVDRVRAASDRRRKVIGLPGSQLITGGSNKGAQTSERTFTTGDGAELRLRIYRPRDAAPGLLPVIVNFHGGGFVSGDVMQSEWWCSSVAAQAGVVVVSVGYRLSPESPYPGPVEDCYAGLEWTAAHAAELGVDPSRLAVMGDSAGGNLAAVISLLARDRKGPAIALQILLYPAVDFVTTFPSELENAHAPVLGKADMDNVPRLYLHGTAHDIKEPYVSPLLAESHEGLPTALIQTAQYDPLRDQGPAYASKLRAAGVQVRLTNYAGAVHGYISLPGVVPAAHQAVAEVSDEVRRLLG